MIPEPDVALRRVCFSARRLLLRLVCDMDLPLTNYHFQVEWGGQRLGFTEVSGLDIEYTTISYRDGSDRDVSPSTMPGQAKPSVVTLKRGMVAGDNDFFEWVRSVHLNSVERRDVIVKLLDEQHQPAFVWRIRNAWPIKYSGPELSARGSEVAIESLELAHEGITVEAL